MAGFEPVDVLTAMLSIMRQSRLGRPTVANCYPRAVRDTGNVRAQEILSEVFDPSDALWRGIGVLPGTGLALRERLGELDALAHYGIAETHMEEKKTGCRCDQVLMGRIDPVECPLFRVACTPENPQGSCMVSTEGTCRARFLYPGDI
jgi:hydrogenase expression/formation protein HypD